jgi:dTDP-4-amino-4,6-dideoxygalactose transaminase
MKLALFGGKAVREKPFPLYPSFGEEEKKAVIRVMDSNALCSMVGEEVKNF